MNKKILLLLPIIGVLLICVYSNSSIKDDKTVAEPNNKTVVHEVNKIIKQENVLPYFDGWVEANTLNVRNNPSINSEIIGTLSFNEKISYTNENEEWVKIKYNNRYAYVHKDYISDKEINYKSYTVPNNRGFKSYMDYKCITLKSSKQYKLQNLYAITGNYGIRTVNGRYCIAVGSYFTKEIGQYLDLILENGTVIPCILSDQKADKDTDSNNIKTEHNGCVSEFVVDTSSLNKRAKRAGNISACCDEWNSPVVKIIVYDENVFDN